MLRVCGCAGRAGGWPVTPLMVWPFASDNGVGVPESLISQIDTWFARTPIREGGVIVGRWTPRSHGLGRVIELSFGIPGELSGASK